jgi:hypothetical protein
MNHNLRFTTGAALARISIWTVVHHDWLAAQIRFYIWTASAIVLLLSIAGIIPLQIALVVLLFCGLGMMILLWSLIRWRRSILLAIGDAKLKQSAHAAMLSLIHSRRNKRPVVEDQNRSRRHWLKKKSHS